ncbi:S9 family peptidase [Caulobacter sp. FWC2]|uniref:alpha/beta hydrolase family protein n=1 Tax=Caulobacter sp. FWC2 TaxID=69664 RepID=UPI0011778D8F|nr:alpha/beta fold hydrolase [Caulobacter sp. FWC2]
MEKLGAIGAIVLTILAAGASAGAEEATGNWTGSLPSGFKVRLRIDKTATGYAGVLINPSNMETTLDTVTSDGTKLSFAVEKLGLRYDAAWDGGSKGWRGDLVFQGSHPLLLQRAAPGSMAARVRKRPQEDAIASGPRPYVERGVVFRNETAGIDLAGTLSLPEGAGPFPAVVLVSGTGPNTRDEEVDGHKVFTVLADALVRQGLAVLRYDKRGVGGSGGAYRGATTADFATDGAAAVRFLMAYLEIDPLRVGVLGHSEGGVIAPMVAASDPTVAFIVMMAVPAIRGDKLFVAQSAKVARLYGAPEAYVAGRQALDRELYAAVIAAPTAEAARAEAKTILARGVENKLVDAGEADSLAKSITSRWQRYFLAHDPALVLRGLKIPVLAVYGGLDAQVPAADNAVIAREALKDVQGATVVEMPGLNHLLQRAETGSPEEYVDIDETVSPHALELMASWMVDRVRTGDGAAVR